MTHNAKQCLSRPRTKGAKWTGKDIQADEVVVELKLGWDAKRDRWNGYDAGNYGRVVRDFEELEGLKRRLQQGGSSSTGGGAEDVAKGDDGVGTEEAKEANDDDDLRYAEESDMGRQQSTSTRNLRLREDTAKYLVNLDLDSAKYDPKSRSMINSGAEMDQAAMLVAEDNFMRVSGDAAEFEKAQKYAWESQERGSANKIHIQANPTAGEFTRRKEEKEGKERREAERKALLQKYGGEKHLQTNSLRDATITESEQYVEYDELGQIKGAPKIEQKSKYPEDIHLNNHTSVFGSWWKDFQWGYACCHSTVKSSYCTGEEGIEAFEEAEKLLDVGEGGEEDEVEVEVIGVVDMVGKGAEQKKNDRKRTVAEMQNGITEEELEEYKRSKAKAEDPMAKLLGRDELMT